MSARTFLKLCQQQIKNSPKNVNSSIFTIVLRRNLNKFTGVNTHDFSHITLNEERAHNIIFNIKDSERQAIKTALEKYEALKLKEGFEGKLAATQWRTRFGRRSTVPSLGKVDPTGAFCEVPDEWLKKKSVESAKAPCNSDLWRIFLVNAVPFVGFGFLDNFIMIAAGDYIDHAFGTFMCISTMAAAALGNTISDILGIGSAFYVERGCELMGLRPPDLTPHQMELNSVRRSANMGRIIGITVGCLIGMVPLLFIDNKSTETSEQTTNEATTTSTSTSLSNATTPTTTTTPTAKSAT